MSEDTFLDLFAFCSDFLGEIVHHDTLGKGKIIKINLYTLTVGSAREKPFPSLTPMPLRAFCNLITRGFNKEWKIFSPAARRSNTALMKTKKWRCA